MGPMAPELDAVVPQESLTAVIRGLIVVLLKIDWNAKCGRPKLMLIYQPMRHRGRSISCAPDLDQHRHVSIFMSAHPSFVVTAL